MEVNFNKILLKTNFLFEKSHTPNSGSLGDFNPMPCRQDVITYNGQMALITLLRS